MRTLLSAAHERAVDRERWASESAAARQRAEALFQPADVAARLDSAYRLAMALAGK
jgi:hypothetical protein